MTGRFALLCPGQGAQQRGMFDMARADPAAGALLDTVIAQAGLDTALDKVLADDALLFANRHAQPLVVAATLANWKALERALPPPAIVAGYSIGEVAAYAVAGALAPVEAVALARVRAGLMDACLGSMPRQALLSVSGLPLGAMEALVRRHDFHIAIVNGDDSMIAGGPADQAQGLRQALAAAGARSGLLPVAVASHTPFMAGAVAPLAARLRQALGDPRVPVLSGISGERITQRTTAIEHLSRQVAEPVLWRDCMDALVESGITVALELGPGAGLSRMLQMRHPQVATRSVADFRSLDGVLNWLGRHVD
ncbi:MAG: malonyl CoA-ACP transacylase [Massilia sp.]|nr:malonyl CoA-ACP transacylase [Massilia sp.]